MTEKRKQELRQLLTEAMKYVVIETPERYEPISVEKYRECAKAFREAYRPDLSFILLYYTPNIQNETVRSKLLKFIKEELTDYIRQNESAEPPWNYSICPANMAIRGVNILPCPLNLLLEKFLEISIASGMDKAISALDKCTTETSEVFQKIVLLQGPIYGPALRSGTKNTKEIHVFDGIRLVLFPLNPSEFPPYLFDQKFNMVLSSAGPSAFRRKTVLIIDHTVSPLFSKPSTENENQFEIKTKSAEFPNFDVEKFCQAFSLVCNYAVEPVLDWLYIDENELFNPRGVTTEIIDVRTPKELSRVTIIDETHIEKIKDQYRELVNLSSDVVEKLQIPIQRWIKSKTDDNPVDKMIDLGIAFEALYLSDIDASAELSFRLRLRAAWHLGKDKVHREELMKDLNKIYEWRSKSVHIGKIPNKTKRTSFTDEEVREFIEKSQDLCRQSIIKILEEGKFPDWNNLILG